MAGRNRVFKLLALLALIWRFMGAQENSLGSGDLMPLLSAMSGDTEDYNNSTDSQPTTLYLLSLLPYPDPVLQPSFDEGPAILIAGQLAVDLINANDDILPGYKLELLTGDGGCNIVSKTNVALLDNLFYNRDKSVVGIVGPGCSGGALTVSGITSNPEVSLLTVHVANSFALSDREAYVNSFGVLSSADSFVRASIKVSQRNNWTKFSLLYDELRLQFLTTPGKIREAVESFSNFSLVLSSAVYNTFIPLEAVRQTQTRIIVLIVGPDLLSNILCLGYHMDMVYPVYQWVFIARTLNELKPVEFQMGGRSYSCDMEQLLVVANRSIQIHYRFDPIDPTAMTDTGLQYLEFLSTYIQLVHERNLQPSFFAGTYFDAVWSMALALNNSVEPLRTRLNLELSEYGYGQRNATEIIRDEFLKLNFNGVSGNINFSDVTGYANRTFNVFQVINNSMVLIEYLNGTHIVPLGGQELEYISDNFDEFYTVANIPTPLAVTFLIISVVALFLLAICHVLTIYYRNNRTVKANSFKVLQMAFLGCYLLTCNVILYTFTEAFDNPGHVRCTLYHALNSCGFAGLTLLFATLLAKTWRIYRIFFHYLNPGKFITDLALFIFISVAFIIELLFLIIWPIVSPLQLVSMRFQSEQMVRLRCIAQNNFYVWFIGLFVYNGVFILMSLLLAIRCQSIPKKEFKTTSIIFLVYIIILTFAVGYSVYFLLPVSPNIIPEYLVLSLSNISAVYECIGLLLFFPIYPILKEKFGPKEKLRKLSQVAFATNLTFMNEKTEDIL